MQSMGSDPAAHLRIKLLVVQHELPILVDGRRLGVDDIPRSRHRVSSRVVSVFCSNDPLSHTDLATVKSFQPPQLRSYKRVSTRKQQSASKDVPPPTVGFAASGADECVGRCAWPSFAEFVQKKSQK
jgi:hypothetical protein